MFALGGDRQILDFLWYAPDLAIQAEQVILLKGSDLAIRGGRQVFALGGDRQIPDFLRYGPDLAIRAEQVILLKGSDLAIRAERW